MKFPIHFTAPDRSRTYIGETRDVSTSGFSVQVKTDDPLPTIILAGILPSEIAGDAILCKARVVWQGGLAGGTKRASYKITSIARQSQERLDALIDSSVDQLIGELQSLSTFADLERDQLELLLQFARARECSGDVNLYGNTTLQGTGLFILVNGEAVQKNDPQKRVFGPGSVMGQWSDPAATPVPKEVLTVSPVRVLHLSTALAHEIQQKAPALAMTIQRALGEVAAPPKLESAGGKRRHMRMNVIQDLQEIPTLPAIFNAVMDCIENPDATPRELSQIIRKDQSLTAKILRTVNSALYGFARRINSVHEAVVLLGMNQSANLAITAMLLNTLVNPRHPKQRPEAFWEHSLACAYFAGAIGERLSAKPQSEQLWALKASRSRAAVGAAAGDAKELQPLRNHADDEGRESFEREQTIPVEQLFMLAILHDIGLAVLYLKFPEHYTLVSENTKDFGTFHRAELELLDMDHCQLGYRIAQAWNLPEPIPTVIAEHHLPQIWCEDAESGERAMSLLKEDPVVTLVALADLLTRHAEVGVVQDCEPPDIPPTMIEALGLTEEDLAELIDLGDAIKEKAEALFRGMSG